MLLQFSVENYGPIKNKVILSLEPSSDKMHPENILSASDYKALNTILVYGANASGKTSLFRAMTIALIMIRQSEIVQVTDKLPVVPFKFDHESINNPSSFEFTFVADDDKKYIYGFSASIDKIIDEYLYVYNTSRPSLIFDRTETDQYKFPRSIKREMDLIVRRNTANKLFLSTATSWNIDATKVAFEWLRQRIDTFTNITDMQGFALDKYRTEKNREYSHFTELLFKQADINISRIQIETKEVLPEQLNNNPFGIVFNLPPGQRHYQYEITTSHSVVNDKGESEEYILNLNEESLGTQQLLTFGPVLKDAFDNGKTIVIDEIDKSLHPFIVKFLINLFRDTSINTGGAQLIATTHETPILSLSTFRKDQIYFTEKNNETGVADLYSLDEFSIRKTDNIEKGYLLGRYGAIPFPYTDEVI